MDVDVFRKLERFNILYDIAIDEETYNKGDYKILIHSGIDLDVNEEIVDKFTKEIRNNVGIALFDKDELSKISKVSAITEAGENIDLVSSDDLFDNYWFNLLIGKRFRAFLQEIGNPPGQLDEVARFLLSKQMEPPKLENETVDNFDYEALKTIYIIYLNEISACFKGELSIGFADKALTFINIVSQKEDCDTGNRNIYELLALYNMGRGLQHRHRHSEALNCLYDVLNAFKNDGPNDDYLNKDEALYRSGKIHVRDNELWRNYLLHLTELTIAEVLSDLNRASEVVDYLEPSWENTYKDAWRTIIKADAKIDGGFWHRCENLETCTCKISDCDDLIDRSSLFEASYKTNSQILYQKYLTVITRYRIERFRRETICQLRALQNKTVKIASGKIECLEEGKVLLEFLNKALDNGLRKKGVEAELNKLLDYTKATSSFENTETSDDIKQVYLLWLDYFDALRELDKLIGKIKKKVITLNSLDHAKREIENRHSEIALLLSNLGWKDHEKTLFDIFIICFKGNRWLQDQESRRDSFCKVIEYVNTKYGNLFNEIEIEALKDFLNDSKILEWKKVKYERRLQSLGQVINGIYSLPDNCSVTVINRSSEIYCGDALTCGNTSFSDCTNDSINDSTANVLPSTCRAGTYYQILKKNTDDFNKQLIFPSIRPVRNAYCLTVLRRWQSFTPALSSGIGINSKGGGYFIYKTNGEGLIEEGIVVDPGFDFLENFQHEGFSIHDITAVIMTHAHVDHTVDFTPIISLFAEYNKRTKGKEKRLLAIMSAGCFDMYSQTIYQSKELFKDVVVANYENGDVKLFPNLDQLQHFAIETKRALHQDFTRHDSIGITIKAKHGNSHSSPIVSLTGDTRWWHGIEEQYNDSSTICINLGAIVKVTDGSISKFLNNEDKVKKILQDENHLYWPGFTLLIESLLAIKSKTKLVIMTELGEELKGGLKTDLAKALNERYGYKPCFLPEDIGLTLRLSNEELTDFDPKAYCFACNSFVEPKNIIPIPFGKEEATFYICKACWEFRQEMVREQIIHYHDNGWPLRVKEDM